MKKINLLPLLAVGLLAAGCSKENPFESGERGEGSILKSALAMEIKADALERLNAPQRGATRATEANPDDFTVIFSRAGSDTPAAKYKYGEMPEVVTLPEGTYTVTATYGENREAEWESPYFLGSSAEFDVVAYEITSYIDPVECRLENVKVTVDFDPMLRAAMSDDSHVEVKVGTGASLHYTAAEADAEKGGYFLHSGETTLVATFEGQVNGQPTVETKTLRNVEKGNHYKIKFKLHTGGGSETSGDADTDLNVDASVTVVDVTRDVEVGDEPLLDDRERPNEGGGTTPPDVPTQDPPTVAGQAPLDMEGVNDSAVFGEDAAPAEVYIHSTAAGGITAFTCDIESPTLTEAELAGVGLSSHLDFVNTPADMVEVLESLGFPVNVGGEKDVKFVITKFIPMLGALGKGEHHFILRVTDANGTTTQVLKFKS